jgi:hypothetical protein
MQWTHIHSIHHHGLFIYLDINYPSLYHNVTSCNIQVFIRIDNSISPMVMITLNTYWEIWVIRGGVYYVKDTMIGINTRFWPWCNVNLQHWNACRFSGASRVGWRENGSPSWRCLIKKPKMFTFVLNHSSLD